jgi:tetratricopeptide (TPR) repeat protein
VARWPGDSTDHPACTRRTRPSWRRARRSTAIFPPDTRTRIACGCQRGDFVHLVVEQQGIDVAVTLVRPDGRELVAVDAMDDEFRPEVVAAIADVAGAYTLTTRPAAAARARGRYSIRLDPPRPAGATDEIRVEAEQAFVRGRTRRDVNTAATWPDALADLTTARDRYRSAGDRPGEMKSLIEIAVTENYMSRPEAESAAGEAERLARAIGDRPALARVLRVAASIHVLGGNLDAALRAAEEATAVNRAVGNRVAEANSLNYTAIVLRRLGDLETAIALYEQARPLARLERRPNAGGQCSQQSGRDLFGARRTWQGVVGVLRTRSPSHARPAISARSTTRWSAWDWAAGPPSARRRAGAAVGSARDRPSERQRDNSRPTRSPRWGRSIARPAISRNRSIGIAPRWPSRCAWTTSGDKPSHSMEPPSP